MTLSSLILLLCGHVLNGSDDIVNIVFMNYSHWAPGKEYICGLFILIANSCGVIITSLRHIIQFFSPIYRFCIHIRPPLFLNFHSSHHTFTDFSVETLSVIPREADIFYQKVFQDINEMFVILLIQHWCISHLSLLVASSSGSSRKKRIFYGEVKT